MFKTKTRNIITAMAMLVVMTLSLLLPTVITAKEEVATRDINVSELGMLSYEAKAEEILGNFDNYEISNDEKTVSLEAEVDLSGSIIVNNTELSADASTTIKKYAVDLDMENEKFYILVQYLQDDVIVHEERVETTPYYDEYTDDYLVEMPDGTTISMYETLNSSNLDECCATIMVLGVALTAKEAAVLLAAVVIVAAPVITNVVTVIVETIVTWVKSFWSWFKSLWTAKTTTKTTTVVTQTISYTISIAGTQVDVKKYDNNRRFDEGEYYVAIADTADGFLYVSDYKLNDIQALAILTSSTYVTGATRNRNGVYPQLCVSLYTANGYDAFQIAVEAGTILGDPGAVHHFANRAGYFHHYHPGSTYTDLSHPHVFYGQPV